jgi:putative transposase
LAQSFTNLIYHIVFSTKDRQPLITDAHQSRLYDYIGGTIRELGGISLAINGTEDHVHLLVKLRPDKALSDVLRDLKANASGWMHDVFPDLKDYPGNAVTEHLLSVNRILRKSGITLRDRKSIIGKNLPETSS